MTCQIPNLYRYRGEYCWTPDVDDEGIIDRDTFPELRTAWNCTACYRKFIAYFDIDEERGLLVLDELEGLERENPPDIGGVKARIMLWDEVTTQEDMQGEPRGCVYKLQKPIAWSGKMRLVKRQSSDLVAECFFENGELVHVNDLTGTKLTDYRAPSMSEADMQEVARILPKIEEAIRFKAYELWQERGCLEGTAEQDWYDAERMLLDIS